MGETLITAEFQVKLDTANQWYRWVVELKSKLKIIIGANGIVLPYVIRKYDTPDPTVCQP